MFIYIYTRTQRALRARFALVILKIVRPIGSSSFVEKCYNGMCPPNDYGRPLPVGALVLAQLLKFMQSHWRRGPR